MVYREPAGAVLSVAELPRPRTKVVPNLTLARLHVSIWFVMVDGERFQCCPCANFCYVAGVDNYTL